MTARIVVGLVVLACVAACGLMSTLVTSDMLDKVSEKLPEAESLSHLGWYPAKHLRLNREYKRFYPDGKLLRRTRILTAFMFVGVLVAAWSFGFFAN